MHWAGNLQPTNGSEIAIGPERKVAVSFDIALEHRELPSDFKSFDNAKLINCLGLKGFVHYTSNNQPWPESAPEISLEQLRAEEQRGENNNYKISAKFTIPKSVNSLLFNIKLLLKSGQVVWLTNNTQDNNWYFRIKQFERPIVSSASSSSSADSKPAETPAEKLAALIEERHESVRSFAKVSGIGRGTVHNLVKGKIASVSKRTLGNFKAAGIDLEVLGFGVSAWGNGTQDEGSEIEDENPQRTRSLQAAVALILRANKTGVRLTTQQISKTLGEQGNPATAKEVRNAIDSNPRLHRLFYGYSNETTSAFKQARGHLDRALRYLDERIFETARIECMTAGNIIAERELSTGERKELEQRMQEVTEQMKARLKMYLEHPFRQIVTTIAKLTGLIGQRIIAINNTWVGNGKRALTQDDYAQAEKSLRSYQDELLVVVCNKLSLLKRLEHQDDIRQIEKAMAAQIDGFLLKIAMQIPDMAAQMKAQAKAGQRRVSVILPQSPNTSFGEGNLLPRHYQADLIIQAFPKKIIKTGSCYKKKSWEEILPIDLESQNAIKICNAARALSSLKPKNKTNRDAIARANRFERETTVIEVDVPSHFLLYGKEENGRSYYQVTHIGKESKLIYIPARFLENIEDSRYIATVLHHDQMELEEYSRILENGRMVTFEDVEAAHGRAMKVDPFNTYAKLTRRCWRMMAASDMFTVALAHKQREIVKRQIATKEAQLKRAQTTGQAAGKTFPEQRSVLADIANLNIQIACLYDLEDSRKQAVDHYKLAIDALTTVREDAKVDLGGLLPLQMYVRIVYLLAKQKMLADLRREFRRFSRLEIGRKISEPELCSLFMRNNFDRIKEAVIEILERHLQAAKSAKKQGVESLQISQAIKFIQGCKYVSKSAADLTKADIPNAEKHSSSSSAEHKTSWVKPERLDTAIKRLFKEGYWITYKKAFDEKEKVLTRAEVDNLKNRKRTQLTAVINNRDKNKFQKGHRAGQFKERLEQIRDKFIVSQGNPKDDLSALSRIGIDEAAILRTSGYDVGIGVAAATHKKPSGRASSSGYRQPIKKYSSRVIVNLSRNASGHTYPGRLIELHSVLAVWLARKIRASKKKIAPNIAVVDVGFGDKGAPTTFDFARILRHAFDRFGLTDTGISIIGVERDRQAVKMASESRQNNNLSPKITVRFIHEDEFDLVASGIKNADMITCSNVLSHYYTPADKAAAVKGMALSLKEGGWLVLASGDGREAVFDMYGSDAAHYGHYLVKDNLTGEALAVSDFERYYLDAKKSASSSSSKTLTFAQRKKIRLAVILARKILKPYALMNSLYHCPMHTMITIYILGRLGVHAVVGYSRQDGHLCLIIHETGHYVDVFPQDIAKPARPAFIIAPDTKGYYERFVRLDAGNEMFQRF
ncbi:MAG: methyltransferase domain-containing protein, partial [Candidatus Omnitrophica bacterium]|nr:methyltransferase domain-containing protein [Candidatus Omnitrophota bacterium]